MRLFRSTPIEFGTEELLFQGTGAMLHPGRWNSKGMACVYSSTTIEASVSERAYHSLMQPIDTYNKQVSQKGKKFPKSYFDDTQKIQFKLAEFEIEEIDNFVNLTSDESLGDALLRAGMPQKTLLESRVDKYELLKPMWTRQLGKFLYEQKYSGMIVPSARTESGNTVVVFDGFFKPDSYELIQIKNLELSARSVLGKPLRPGMLAEESRVNFRYGSLEGVVGFLTL